MRHRFIISVALCGALMGCGEQRKKAEEEAEYARKEQEKENTFVKVQVARRDRFNVELVSNGKAEAHRKATVHFELDDVVREVRVKNGDRVPPGEVLAVVDDEKAQAALEEAHLSLQKSLLELKSALLGDGLKTLEDTVKLTPARKKAIYLQSGYAASQKALRKAQKEYTKVKTKAPFAGIVADVEAKPYNQSSTYKALCTLIDDSRMEVVFNVLETEIANLQPGMEVKLCPYANPRDTLHGEVTEVNPRIDENGMVRVKAVTNNRERVLVDGMNVSILIKRQIEEKVIIPKSAVLPRQGKKVVFLYQKGKAVWRYVTTSHENSTEICIEKGIQPGDTVIHENNLGLSHMNTVTIE